MKLGLDVNKKLRINNYFCFTKYGIEGVRLAQIYENSETEVQSEGMNN